MYHCHVRFYFTGAQPELFAPLKEMPPLEAFTHEQRTRKISGRKSRCHTGRSPEQKCHRNGKNTDFMEKGRSGTDFACR